MRARLWPQDVDIVGDLPVTSVARTLVDVARSVWPTSSVPAFDHAIRENMTTFANLADVWQRCKRWPGARKVRAAIEATDGRAESPLESWSRMVLMQAGIVQPELQTTIRGPGGDFLGRADFYWDQFGVVGEADGRAKYADRDVLMEEKLRQERLEQTGLVVVRWTWDDVRRDGVELRRRLNRAFERARARDAAGVPRNWRATPLPPRTLPRELAL